MNLTTEPGWTGVFTRESYPGALPPETRIVKVRTEEGDAHPIGSNGTVIGSMGHPTLSNCLYFVEWDARPKVAVAVVDWKIGALPPAILVGLKDLGELSE